MERRLTAILASDVVGYSRLIRENEAGTLAIVKSHRERLFEPIVAAHNGRIVKLMGDGLLIDFASAVEAVQCAVNMQHYVGIDNKDIPQNSQVRYRIGLNVGDFVMDQDDIHGDGVNVAARIESLSDPDGIYMSAKVIEQVKTKLDLNIEDLGKHQVKIISDPIHVFSLVMDEKARAVVSPIAPLEKAIKKISVHRSRCRCRPDIGGRRVVVATVTHGTITRSRQAICACVRQALHRGNGV
ncbi:adenylate/guanylate cyclase domain-containing protein [uncultured Ruegeria sp.]|uniref:adenylate/guanylate cyclase domain-containing protein n=1 Tax=uncultured Ruegeria sp. TaxID=259304 RepID=UPI002636D3F8|nr:adenylate/guanylate cyclase domain-containing protein [uncultured Ruegeria sp.]